MDDEEIRRLFESNTRTIVDAIIESARAEERFMADELAQALADLTAAFSNVEGELSSLVAIIVADASASAESVAAAGSIETLITGLNTAVSAAQSATSAPPPPPPAADPADQPTTA